MTGDGRGAETQTPTGSTRPPAARVAASRTSKSSCQDRTRSPVQTRPLGRGPGASSASAATLAGSTPGCCLM
jgi:hypothetical protein